MLEALNEGGFSLGGEQSGHIIIRDLSTTGDGQLTATQLLCHMRCEGKTLSELASVMTRYPQITVNIKTTNEGKLAFLTDREIEERISEIKIKLGDDGRVLARPSGTEPLVRIMIEGKSISQIEELSKELSELIEKKIYGK